MTLPPSNLPYAANGVNNPASSRRLVQQHKSSARWLQIILDFALVAGLLYLHTWLKGAEFDTDYRVVGLLALLLMAVVYNLQGVYLINTSILNRSYTVAKAWATVLALMVVAGFVTKTSSNFSREVFLTWAVTGYVAQILSFMVVRHLQARSRNDVIPTLVVGTEKLAQYLAEQINGNPWIPDQVVGLVSYEHSTTQGTGRVPLLGNISQLEDLIKAQKIRRVYIALSMSQTNHMQSIYLQLAELPVDIIWAPDIFSVNLLNHSIRELAGLPLISLSETPLIGSSAFIKTVMDFSIASAALILTSPIMLLTAAAIRLTSPGPILFTQQRHGWDGRIITIYKFRSMKLHQEEAGKVTQASKEDDRITPVGKFIRRTSIDELPQLFNVINGSMSIVGPRPHALEHNYFYGSRIKDYMSRHRVKPGLTGLAQVNGFRGETRDLGAMEGRVQYDLAYINNWSPWLDIKIMIKTAFVLLDKNAY